MPSMTGTKPWRSLDELADTPEFRELLQREFPAGAAWLDAHDDAPDAMRRRRFIQLMGASFGLAGITVVRPPGTARKSSLTCASRRTSCPASRASMRASMPFRGYARGILVESHLGRPTKIEGNPDHPASLGATDSPTQASVLDLYDPDRSKAVRYKGGMSTWDRFENDFGLRLASHAEKNGEGLAILIEPTTSPTMRRLLTELTDQQCRARGSSSTRPSPSPTTPRPSTPRSRT